MQVWPIGDGEIAERIRAFDWSQTPLGPIENWSSRLKLMVELVLANPLISSLVCGPERLLIYNDVASRHYGERHPAALGRPLPEAFPEGWVVVGPLYERAFSGMTVEVGSQPLDTRGEGEVVDVFEASLTPVRDESGHVAFVHMVGQEIGSHLRALSAARESEARHRLRIGSWAQAVWETDAQGVVVVDSPSWRAHTGQTLDEWLGYGWVNAIHPEDRAYAERQWREAIADRGLVDAEFRLRAPDGGWRWTNVRAAPVLDVEWRIEKWAGMNIDIDARKCAEAALRESEDRHRAELERRVDERTAELKGSRDLLQATMDSSMDMIQVFESVRDAAGGIVDFHWVLNNHTSEGYYGDVIGRSLLTSNPGVIEEGIFDAFKRVVETGEPDQSERHYVHEQFDGWFFQSAVKLGDGVATTTKDISDWKVAQAEVLRLRDAAAQEQVRQSEERLRGFGEASTDVLWIRDAETLAWTYLTPAFETIYGLSREEALAGDNYRNWTDLILPEDRDRARSIIDRVRDGESVTFEYRVRRPSDGAIRWLRNTDFPIRDAEGQIKAIGGVGHDASQEKEADRIIRASRRQLRTLVEGVPILVWRGVDGGEWTWSSSQWTAFTGLSEAASTGRGWLAVVHPDDRKRAMDAWQEAERTEQPLAAEYRIRQSSGGAYRWFQTRALPVRDEDTGQILEWLGTSTDIDDLRQMQEEQTVMVAELQHRTRNLIGIVSLIMRQLVRSSGSLPDFQARFTERLEALSRIQGLFSRKGEERIEIGDIVRIELDALGAGLAGERVTVEGESVALRKSAVQTLALAIHELATNARKYGALHADQGRLVVRWAEYATEGDRRRLRFEWTETGIERTADESEGQPHSGGYGRKLIEGALPYTLKAETTYVLARDRLDCTIDMPLDR